MAKKTNKNITKLTLQELIKRKQQIEDSKKTRRKKELYIASLDSSIVIESATKEIINDAYEMPEELSDIYVVYNCVIEPKLTATELHEAYGVKEPYDIVSMIFDDGEIAQISKECIKLGGYLDSVKDVSEIKN